MKLFAALLASSFALAQLAATAQTTKAGPAKPRAEVHHATSAHGACVKLPELSPSLPKLPAETPCAKALYTLSVQPSIKIDYASPMEGTALRDTLGIDTSSFSLAYIDTKLGTGALAEPHKWFSIQYTGYLTDGTKFDSSYDHADHAPFVFQYGAHQVVAGWDTGFAGMRVGGKRRLFIPYQLAYGPQQHGTIPPKSMLVFDVELISQSSEKPLPPAPPAASYMHLAPQKPASAAEPAKTAPEGTKPAPPVTPPATPPTAAQKPQ